jgi:hypothetical protein
MKVFSVELSIRFNDRFQHRITIPLNDLEPRTGSGTDSLGLHIGVRSTVLETPTVFGLCWTQVV